MANRLRHETSPYLLQHADNPVEWHPWGPEALERAREENRPILLSIGYSACHWCHVMERESFEDEEVAEIMNRLFVNVKVDREERPDVDQIYMRAVQAMTGGGGWPLTVFLTPEAVPYYGGTYYPPEPRQGMPSFRQVLDAAARAWAERPDDVERAGGQLLEVLERASSGPGGSDGEVEPGLLEAAAHALSRRYDAAHGGFGTAPKFPQPALLELLVRHHLRSGEKASLEMAVHTLRGMAAGGMRDHLGGGFHRYSVDARWLVPHFEKMLYDNAQLARAYLDGWRLTGDDDLRAVVEETLDWILDDMTDAGGGFYAARDADSEGEEGLFYLWTPGEVEAVLDEDADLFMRTYDVSEGGNFEGRSILHLPHGLDAVARREDIPREELDARLGRARRALLEARAHREAPLRDEKILAGWNGLTVRALAEAGGVLGREDYLAAAVRAADFLLEALRDGEGRLLHVHTDGRAHIRAFLDDHAALANALLSLHEATLDPRWLGPLDALCRAMIDQFWSGDEGLFHDTALDAERLIVRPRDPLDTATPSGNSLAAEALWRAGRLLDEEGWRARARALVAREADTMRQHPTGYGRLLSVADRILADPVEIAIVGGRDHPETQALHRAATASFLPDLVLTGREDGEALPRPVPVLDGRHPVDGRPAAYVCRSYACRAPVTTPEGLLEELAS